MNPVIVKNIEIGTGIPKICVPIVGTTRNQILEAAAAMHVVSADIVEWRVDWYEDIFDWEKTRETLALLRRKLNDVPILFTFRTLAEGGEKEIDTDAYIKLNERAAGTGDIDMIDVEASAGDEKVRTVIEAAHGHGVKVIVSNHDFQKTPSKEEIITRLCNMQKLGADIPKIAVMPESRKDVLTLLLATEEMVSTYADRPIITMSMAGSGVISRLCGEVFGSAVTFGAAGQVSAPGQIKVEELRTVLELLHKSL